MKTYKRVLSIAGSDSGGGAGVQADLKAISACGCFAMTAITAVTAQNTLGVRAIESLPVNVIEAQIRACLDDIGVDAVKIGMLHSVEVIQARHESISRLPDQAHCRGPGNGGNLWRSACAARGHCRDAKGIIPVGYRDHSQSLRDRDSLRKENTLSGRFISFHSCIEKYRRSQCLIKSRTLGM